MKFKTAVREGILLKRYKRFFADVNLSGDTVVAHVPNTGSMKGANEPGRACLVTESDNPERKLKFTLEAVKSAGGAWIGVNTSWPNQLAKEAFNNKVFAHWQKFDQLQAEVKLNPESRIDLVLTQTKTGKKHYVEIKNVTLAVGDLEKNKGTAQFPDAVTERGQKHLRELMKLVDDGHTAEILFTVQRGDCITFSPADDIDEEYGKLLREAVKKGVTATAAVVRLSPDEIVLTNQQLPINL